MPNADIERFVRKWFVMSVLTGRYSASPETTFDYDIRQIDAQGIQAYADNVKKTFRGILGRNIAPELNTSAASSPHFRLFQAAQVKMNDRGFLSRDITARELVEIKCDVHHLFPRDYLKRRDCPKVSTIKSQTMFLHSPEINIAIGNKEPKIYFTQFLNSAMVDRSCTATLAI